MRMDVSGITQGYDGRPIIQDISFSARSGEMISIIGPNGCGKSTLMKTLCGIRRPMSGSISIDGICLSQFKGRELARTIGYVPQSFVYAGFSSVYDTVLMGRRPYMEWSYSDEDLTAAAEAMIMMNVGGYVDRYVNELSGGQMQRVIIARAIAQNPEFYVFDEPTSAFDLRNQMDMMRMMRGIIRKKDACLLVALHDLNLALRYSDKVIVMADGRMHSFGPPGEVITASMIKDVYRVSADIIDGRRGPYIQPYDDDGDMFLDL